MFLVNSRLGLFIATSSRFLSCKQLNTTLTRHPFFRSYGANLPSSLTRVFSSALVRLHQPTCVSLRYGHLNVSLRGFSRQLNSISSSLKGNPHHSSGLMVFRIYLENLLCCLDPIIQDRADLSFCVTPSLSTVQVVPEFSPRLSIAYATSLGLGPTYPGRISLPQETLGFRRKVYSSLSRYSCRHHLFYFVQVPHGSPSLYRRMLPYQAKQSFTSAVSVIDLSLVEFSAQDRSPSELLRTL